MLLPYSRPGPEGQLSAKALEKGRLRGAASSPPSQLASCPGPACLACITLSVVPSPLFLPQPLSLPPVFLASLLHPFTSPSPTCSLAPTFPSGIPAASLQPLSQPFF